MKVQKPIAILFAAHVVSGLAQGISLLAVPWYFAKEGLSSQYNFYYGVLTLFIVFWGLFAGTLVDKYPRIKVFVVSNLLEGIVLAGVAWVGFHQGSLSSTLVFLVLGITFLGFNVHYPNMYAFLQEMTREEEYPKISSVIEVVGQSTSVLSGALAAMMLDGGTIAGIITIQPWKLWEIFALDAFTYFLSLILISGIDYVPIRTRQIEVGPLLERLKGGFSYLKHHVRILLYGLLPYSVFACVMVQIYTLLPVYVKEHLGKGGSVFATCDLLFACGALLAGVAMSKVLSRYSWSVVLPVAMFLSVIAYVVAFSTKSISIFYMVCFLFGCSNSATRIVRISFLLSQVPNYVLGRVNSVFLVLNIVERSSFIFLFSSPWFLGKNVSWAYLVLGCFILVNTLFLLVVLNYPTNKASRSKASANTQRK